jgi:acetyltransferase-like isoleucine patch superfamily enzyme
MVQDDCFIGPNATLTNDALPRSKRYPEKFLKTVLEQGCSIGANSTILPGLVIGRWAMVGAGAVVTHDVPDFAIVVGNPARHVGWVCRCGQKLKETGEQAFECGCGQQYKIVEGRLVCRPE